MIARVSGLLTRSVAAVFVAVATVVVLPVAPAQAAACPGATGVTVVVDYKQLGGGVAQGCASSGGGKTAAANFSAAGFPLTYVQRSPGFVCRVSGKPAADPCVNTPPVSAYWSLWWSDGKSGKWTYSSLGAGSLKVPTGGYVAFAWQGQAAKATPGVAATKRAAAAAPSPEPAPPSKSPSRSPSKSPTNPTKKDTKTESAEPTSSVDTSESASTAPETTPAAQGAKSGDKKKSEKSDKPSTSPTTSSPSAAPTETVDDGLDLAAASSDPPSSGSASRIPTWAAIPLFVALVGAIAGVTVLRGRRDRSLGGN